MQIKKRFGFPLTSLIWITSALQNLFINEGFDKLIEWRYLALVKNKTCK